MISFELIEEFRTLYLEAYGVQISSEEAEEKAYRLLRLYKKVLTINERGIENAPEQTKF